MPHAYVRYRDPGETEGHRESKEAACSGALSAIGINQLPQSSEQFPPAGDDDALANDDRLTNRHHHCMGVCLFVCLVRCSHFMLSHMCLPFFGERLFNAFALLASF